MRVLAFAVSALFLLRFFRAIAAIDLPRLDSVCTRRARTCPQCRLRARAAEYAEFATANSAAEISHFGPMNLLTALGNFSTRLLASVEGFEALYPSRPSLPMFSHNWAEIVGWWCRQEMV